jgi:hypothetical protein
VTKINIRTAASNSKTKKKVSIRDQAKKSTAKKAAAKVEAPAGPRSLTKDERDTVILFGDYDDIASIVTWQRTVITKLKKNPDAKLVEEMHYGTSAGARFEMSKNLISFRRKRKGGGRTMTDEQKKAAGERLAKARQNRGKK